MKTLLNILMLTVAPLLGWSTVYQMGVIEFSTHGRQAVWVEMDGQTINRYPRQQLRIDRIYPGRRHFRILAPGHRRGHRQVIYDGFLQVQPGDRIVASMDGYGQIRIDRRQHRQYRRQPYHRQRHRGHRQGFYQGYGYSGYGYGYPPHHNPHRQRGILPNGLLNDVERQMRQTGFESTRLDIAKTAVRGNRISARQLRQLMEEFNFESTRLDFAQWAYPYVVDKENIVVIYDAFEFESSIHRFQRHLQPRY